MRRNNWSQNSKNTKFATPRHPPWLKGRQIGLYYSNLQKHKNENKSRLPKMVKLTIPQTVITSLEKNLQTLQAIAKRYDIPVQPVTLIEEEKSITELTEEEKSITECVTISSSPVKDAISNIESEIAHPGPSTSKTVDFIPINKGETKNYGVGDEQLFLRGGGDYKYGYMDLITGTFDEKLEECLSKSIKINSTNPDILKLNTLLKEEYKNMINRSGYRNLMTFREILPTYKKSKELLEVLNSNQVVVISGETGCGKSTQVPQLILDEALKNGYGANIKILVTQPRRIAATSLAMRVAEERGEKVGKSAGYAIRLERNDPRSRGSILFCTTGVLLTDLELDQGLTNYSHVILDEVHERDCHIDLALCMLKQVLKRRADLKLILMSATIDAESLSTYFDNCKIMHIEGLAYPVTDVYLEDILAMTNFSLQPLQPTKRKHRGRNWQSQKKSKNVMEQDIKYRAEISDWLEKEKSKMSRHVYETLKDSRIEELNIDLVFEVLICICKNEPGAILIFLPGIGDITKLLRTINESGMFPKSRYEIYPLHSKLASLEQRKIFQRPPDSVRKIIIATNIAETSITIDDVVYVIDCAKIKHKGLNVEDNVSTLQTEWVSKANLRQRRGRAGRCQPGICYHLLTSYRASLIAERTLPELQRSDLLEPVLTIKRLRLGRAADALNMVPAPPAKKTINWAVQHLQRCGALDDREILTPLGWHLARLPVHPAAGKLLLLGALFGCLDRAATVAAIWSFKDPFTIVIGKEKELDAVKCMLALGEPSDHVAMSEAVMRWEEHGTTEAKRYFAYQHFLSNQTTELLSDMKNQLGHNLMSMGFLPSGDVRSLYENRNANNPSLFKAIVAAALYPNVGHVRWIGLNRNSKPPRIIAYTPEDGRISIHPSSVMAGKHGKGPLCNKPGANYLVYWLKQRSSDLFLIDVTLVHTLPLLFFGELKVTKNEESPEYCCVPISNNMVGLVKYDANLLFQLRSMLDEVLAYKVMTSSARVEHRTEFEEKVLNAVISLITAEDVGVNDEGESQSDSDCSEVDYAHRY